MGGKDEFEIRFKVDEETWKHLTFLAAQSDRSVHRYAKSLVRRGVYGESRFIPGFRSTEGNGRFSTTVQDDDRTAEFSRD